MNLCDELEKTLRTIRALGPLDQEKFTLCRMEMRTMIQDYGNCGQLAMRFHFLYDEIKDHENKELTNQAQ